LGFYNKCQVIKIYKISNGLLLSQSHYIMKILEKFSKCDNNIVKTPIDINIYMSKNKGKRITQLKYSWIIESLIDIMNCKNLILLIYLVNWIDL
jgi:hypothetical protein